ncbi:MAG TPA: FAD-dependent oxidoreductase [Woeseiaceae bacterium]|nr:FAD-dependent oxidoreductase [Woeseiaceae bacterium]
MHVAVLGAGIAGVTTAYALAIRGCEVSVIERAHTIAAGASHANGGQLSYSFTDSLAKPSFIPTLPRLLAGRDPGSRVRFPPDAALMGWGLAFLRQCTSARSRDNTIALLKLALRSAVALEETVCRSGVHFAHRKCGKLVLLPAGADLAAARQLRDLKKRHGCDTEILTPREARAVEPALAGFPDRYAAAIHAAGDDVGDARLFAENLGRWLAATHGVRFRLGETVQALSLKHGRVRGARTDRDIVAADATVVCLGAWSVPLLRQARIRAAIYPVRGYSLTLPRGHAAPSVSITDLRRRLLYCPLDGRMRISGYADFVGLESSCDGARLADLLVMARNTAPDAADYTVDASHPWAGARPMTPDGRPLTGNTPRPGLFVNCGHGMLGWTLASATAEDTAEAVIRAAPSR